MTQEQFEQPEQQGPTREGLKVNALLERIAVLENEKADLRVDFTVLSMQYGELQRSIQDSEGEKAEDVEPEPEAKPGRSKKSS